MYVSGLLEGRTRKPAALTIVQDATRDDHIVDF